MQVEQQLSLMLKNPSITQKCLETSNLIKERFACNMSRSVLSQFKPIVENIFGIEAASDYVTSNNQPTESQGGVGGGWNLRTLTRSSNSSDYESVISFLHPDGILFALIRSLMSETSAKFEFPVSMFPASFRTMIENGTAPPFFAQKIISTSYNSTNHLILNPFEFYLFNYALHILDSSGQSLESSGDPNSEPVYFSLLKIYLSHFVPLENNSRNEGTNLNAPITTSNPNSIWQSLSSTTSSILNLATNSNLTNSNSNNNGSLPSLFKASIFRPQAPFNQPAHIDKISPGPLLYGQGEHLGSLEWRCSTFLLMLTELWFGNIPAPKTNYILRSTSLDDLSFSRIQAYSANIDQMTAVRIVIKHLHNFSNSFTYNSVGHTNSQGLAEIKQAIWTSKYPLQRRLYTFMKIAFNRWPMDYTFRQPLEAWLSYIQPWRYVKLGNEFSSDFDDLDGRATSLIDAPLVDNHWRNFISDNLLYYTVIFSLFINRLLRLDLSSSRNALMLFRVIKVYSQPGFLTLLRDTEQAIYRNNLEHSMSLNTSKSPYKIPTPSKVGDNNTSKAKLLAPSFLASGRVSTPKSRTNALENHLMNLESDSEFNYVSLFSPQMKQHLMKLIAEVQRSRLSIREFTRSVEDRSQSASRGWVDSILTFLSMDDACFESKDEREMYKDKIQAEEYLNFSVNKISQCFELPVPDIDPRSLNTATFTSSQNSSKIFFNY